MVEDNLCDFETRIIQFRESDATDALELTFDIVKTNINDTFYNQIEKEIEQVENDLLILDNEIDKLTNHSEGIDYIFAVISGLTTGLIDSFFIGEINYQESLSNVKQKVNDSVIKEAQKLTAEKAIKQKIKKQEEKLKRALTSSEKEKIASEIYENLKKSLEQSLNRDNESGINATLRRCISKIEDIYKISSDNAFQGIKGMNTLTHHLDDWAHHPTLLGFIAAILSEFFKIGIFTDKNGKWHFLSLLQDPSSDKIKTYVIRIIGGIVLAGLISWLISIISDKSIIQKKGKGIVSKLLNFLPGISMLLPPMYTVLKNWIGHLKSDMAGSKSSPGAGMGIPGFFLSVLKEFSSMPILNKTPLPKIVTDWFTVDRFDMRKEMAVINELGRQTIPVIIGEIMVRSFYFIKQLICCYSDYQCGRTTDWRMTIPVGNRTVERMILIESASFTSCDILDAVIRSAIQNGGNVYNPKLYADLALRINFVGIGKLTLSGLIDMRMGHNRQICEYKKLNFQNKLGFLKTAQAYDMQAKMWISASDANFAIEHMKAHASDLFVFYFRKMSSIQKSMDEVCSHSDIVFDDEESRLKLLEMFD